MRVLLPPSESKRPDGGNAIFTPQNLHFQATLGETRQRVEEAVVAVSTDADRAKQIFKLGAKASKELLHNLNFSEALGLPAIERYVGVLFDEIKINELTTESRTWVNEHVLIQSALFGIVSAADLIPPYRLSASTKLTEELGATLKRTWNSAFLDFAWPESFVLDLRSKDYAALAPIPATAQSTTLDIVQRSADGELRALNHFNKRTKGDLVHRLASSQAVIRSRTDLISWSLNQGLELRESSTTDSLLLVTELSPARAQ